MERTITNFRGIYGILTAAFGSNLDLDEASMRRQAEFCVRGGSHGIVVPVNASEFIVLSDEERRNCIRWTVEQTAGRVPVIAGITAQSAHQAVEFARFAKAVGADGVIAMPPYVHKAPFSAIIEYYSRIADAAQLPVFIQNYIPPVGTPLSAQQCVEIVQKVPLALYVKEETEHSGHVISEIDRLTKDLPEGSYFGTMGGKASRYLIDEYRRNACGNMPACDIVDINAKIWNYLDAGQEESAIALFEKALPLTNMEYMFGYIFYKAVLKRRGVIENSIVRVAGDNHLDELDLYEMDRILQSLESEFIV